MKTFSIRICKRWSRCFLRKYDELKITFLHRVLASEFPELGLGSVFYSHVLCLLSLCRGIEIIYSRSITGAYFFLSCYNPLRQFLSRPDAAFLIVFISIFLNYMYLWKATSQLSPVNCLWMLTECVCKTLQEFHMLIWYMIRTWIYQLYCEARHNITPGIYPLAIIDPE